MKNLMRSGTTKALICVALPALVVLGLLLSTGTATAEGKRADPHHRSREAGQIRAAVQSGEVLPLGRILDLALKHVPGEVLKIELEQKRGTLHYEIKVLTPAGSVREVKLDARTGALIKIEDD